jgi:CHAT domain-containing protein/tetratricopeptide (TPR) repeat protein
MDKSRSNMSGNQQPVRSVGNMGWKCIGSLTRGVLATLVLAIAPISFSEIFFLESVTAQTTQDRETEADVLSKEGRELSKVNKYKEALQAWEQALQIYREIKNTNGERISLNNLGTAYQSLGQYQKAIEYYQQSLLIAKKIGDRKGEGLSLNNIGGIYYFLGQYQKAVEYYQKSLVITKQISDKSAEAASLNGLGSVYRSLGQYQKAIKYYQQSLAIKREIDDLEGEGASINNLGSVYRSLGQYQKAIEYYQQSLAIAKQIGDRNSEGLSLNNLGNAYSLLGQYQKAIDFLQQSLSIAKQIGNLYGEGASLNNIGGTYYFLGQYQQAIEYYQKSLAIVKQIGDRNTQLISLNSLGNAYQSLGQYQKAIEYYQQSLAIAKQISAHNEAAALLNNLGNAYNNLGQYQNAIDFFYQSLAIAKQIGDRNLEGTSLGGLGNAYNYLGQYQKAIDFYQQALVFAKQIGNRNGEGILLNNLGGANNSLGLHQKAIDFFYQSLTIAKQIGNRNGEGISLNNLGESYNSLGKNLKAIEYYQLSLAITKQIGDRRIEGGTLSNLGKLFTEQKQPELAILFYKQSVNVRETIRKDILGLSQTEQKSYLATIEKDYRNLADLLLKQDRILEAQQVLDLLKVQELSDYFRTGDVGDSAKQTDYQPPEQNIIALGNELAKLQDTNPRTKEQEQRLAYLTNQESNLNDQFNAFLQSPAVQKQIEQLKLTNAKNVDLEEYNQLSVNLKEIKNAVVLYPLILEDRLELILITANTPPIRKTTNIKREALNKDISDFLSSLRDPSSTDAQADAKKFYNYLIKPFEAELKEAKIETIIYSPDGQLRYIPLAALHDGKQWLIEKYRINNITSASLTNLRPRTYKTPRVLAAAATNSQNIKIGDQSITFGALPATKTEVEAIASLLPNTTTFIDQQFNKADTIPKMQSNTIIHLATHGYFAIGKPEDSFIIFGDSDRATIADMKKWTLTKVELVVLSACETAIGGKLGNGIEILGLGYQIQNRGAGAAIASLWKVSDNGTSELMQALYKNLSQKNNSSSEALRQAQIAMIRSNKKGNSSDRAGVRIVGTVPDNVETQLSHPFYWSAFILIGNGL